MADPGRLTQLGVELGIEPNPTSGRLTQLGVETIVQPNPTPGRLTQLGIELAITDPTFFGLLDLEVTVSDTLHNWNDTIDLSLIGVLNINLSNTLDNWNDNVLQEFGYFIQSVDTLSLNDSIRAVLELHKSISDDGANLADDITTQILGFERVSIGDTLNLWLDKIELLKENTATKQLVYKPSEVEYIRRYLNDVVIETLGTFTPSSNVVYKPDEISYIRRYLNDV